MYPRDTERSANTEGQKEKVSLWLCEPSAAGPVVDSSGKPLVQFLSGSLGCRNLSHLRLGRKEWLEQLLPLHGYGTEQ